MLLLLLCYILIAWCVKAQIFLFSKVKGFFRESYAKGMLLPRSCLVVQVLIDSHFQVDFVSTTVKKYEIALVVDVDGVGQEILSLPIIAKLVIIIFIIKIAFYLFFYCFL